MPRKTGKRGYRKPLKRKFRGNQYVRVHNKSIERKEFEEKESFSLKYSASMAKGDRDLKKRPTLSKRRIKRTKTKMAKCAKRCKWGSIKNELQELKNEDRDILVNLVQWYQQNITAGLKIFKTVKENKEHAVRFAKFCNICFHEEGVRKIQGTEDLFNILMMFIDNKIIINEEVYLCLYCCQKLETYYEFKQMCLRNFIGVRLEYSALKNTLEAIHDPNMEEKLRNFIESKVYGASEMLTVQDTERIIKSEYNIKSEKQHEENDSSYSFSTVSLKTEIMEKEDREDYKLHTELDLGTNDDHIDLPVPVEHIKVESFVDEDAGATESRIKNKLIEPPKPADLYNNDEMCHTSTEITDHKERASPSEPNKNIQSYNRKIREIERNICRNKYPNLRNLEDYMRNHSGDFTCTDCNKVFSDPSVWNEQERVLAKRKSYVCNICGEAFLYDIALKKHMLIHSDEKSYTCPTCSKEFTKLQNLKQHTCLNASEKPYAGSV